MAQTTTNLKLTVWNNLSDPYDSSQLAQNFIFIDQHDHTGNGKGLPIGTTAISNLAVTNDKIANGTITTAKLNSIASSSSTSSTDVVVASDTRLSDSRPPDYIDFAWTTSGDSPTYTLSTTKSSIVRQSGSFIGTATITLPSAASSNIPAGSEIIIQSGSNVSNSTPIKIVPASGQSINGVTNNSNVKIGAQYAFRRFVSDGTSGWVYDEGVLRVSNNLSDVGAVATARTNLGLGDLVTFSSTAQGTSATLAGTISDKTGSGSLVFGTSPSLTTPKITGSSSGTTTITSANSSAISYIVTIPTATDTLVGLATSDTLTNKTLTAPKITSASSINDVNSNALIAFPTTVASAVNYVTISNATSANPAIIAATGSGTDASLNLTSKGAGTVQANGAQVATLSSSNTLASGITQSSLTSLGTLTSLTTSGDAIIGGDLTVNGATTTINTNTLSVDDKNIELGSVALVTISSTGTVGSISGGGPWTATITGMSSTAGLIPGSAISATNGVGSLGSGGTYVIASIVNKTSITYTATGGTIPTAGTITTIITSGATDVTADNGGFTLKGTTDKTFNWLSATTSWTSSENLNIASGKIYKINGTNALEGTTLGSGGTAKLFSKSIGGASGTVGNIVDESSSQTLTNKTLTSPILTSTAGSGPNPVTITSTQTASGKTITFPNVSANANVITSLGYGASLPSSPADGDEYYYSTSGYVWHLRYTTSLNKWQFVGGSAFIATENGTSNLTATTYTYNGALMASPYGPSLTVPTGMTGIYKVEFGMDVSNTNAGKVNYMGLFTSATGNTSPLGSNTELIVANADTNVGPNPATYTASKIVQNVSLTATNTIYAQFKTSANTATVSNRYISITPVTIG
jgi:hypothetical protein